MPPNTAYSPKGPTKYVGPGINPSSVVTRSREPTGADYRQPENGKLYPVSSFWLVGNDPTTGTQGDMWYLSKIVANVAYWVKISSGSTGPILSITVPNGVSPINPDGAGTMNFTSSAGTITITGSSASPNNHTINFDLSGGSVGIDSVAVQSVTAPGVSPVLPTAAGLITVNGAAVAAHSVPVETRSRALNTYAVEVQIASVVAPTPISNTASGIACYNSSQFQLDATSGMVSLLGSTSLQAILTETADTGGAISPTAGGNLSHLGGGTATGIVTAGSANQINYNVYRWVEPISNNWTAVVAGTTTAGVGTYVKQHAVYSRVGNMIFFTFDLEWSAHTGTGNILITGFPKKFTKANTNYPYIAFVENILLPVGTIQVVFNGTNNTTQGAIEANIDNAVSSAVALPNAGAICCYGFYFSDEA